jgi:4-aminobutyrate aminotransferase-like enzyme/Ser/Thr protein kinase RdoA (MazF antagonist)/murein DD-endopeptidase MepM/ murein hydrolase activator NlpD
VSATERFSGHELRGPRLTDEQAVAIAAEVFGVHGQACELGSQQDQNFLIETSDGRVVLRISNPAFATEELDLQNRAMEHVAARCGGVVSVPLPSRTGAQIVRLDGHDVRMVTYLEGEVLHGFTYLAPGVLRAAGGLIGAITAALGDFDHPCADRFVQWDVARASEVVAAFAPWVADGARRAMIERTSEQAAASLAPLEGDLRRQVIHGDANDMNLLARRGEDGRPVPVGVLDFGDTCRSWLAAECAVLAVSLCGKRPSRVVQDVAELVRGFHHVLGLTEQEVAALPALMAARAALCAAGCEQQAVLEPDKPYAVEGAREAWAELNAIASVPDAAMNASLRHACGMPAPRTPRLTRGRFPVARREVGPVRIVNLSPRTDALGPGAWRDPAALAAVLSGSGLAVGRHGERRIVHDRGPELDEPASVHLGADLFLAPGTQVYAPLPGRVIRRAERELLVAAERGWTLRLAGLVPAAGEAGQQVEAGEPVGSVAKPEAGARLPAHLHVQLAVAELDELPGLVPASLAKAWLTLCPDPSPLLGLNVAVDDEPVESVLARRRRAVASPQRLYFPAGPPQFERGWRQWLYDVDGRPYLDMVNNVAVLGHAHPAVTDAATRQLHRLNTNTRFLYDGLGRYAERLAGLVPDPLEVAFCVNSGSEAVDLALRLVRHATGRRDLVCFAGAYHGWTAAADETMHPPPWVHPIDPPHLDPRRSLAQLRRVVERNPPAALLCEPLLGNWGGALIPDGWLAEAYQITRAAGGLCIADEVQVGYGRSGSHFWAFEQQGVVPDLVTLAKPAGNGHPLGAVIATREIADAFNASDNLFSSPGGGPVSCEVGLAVIDAIEREGLQENARRVGRHLTARLAPLVDEFELVSALHGIGLYRGVELTHPDGRPARAVAFAVCERLLELGIVVQPTGPSMNVLKLKPPLCIAAEDIDLLAGALRLTLSEGW